MKKLKCFSYRGFRPLLLSGGLLIMVFLQACSTYSTSHGYPSRSYSHQSSYYPGHAYPSDRYYGHSYYGSYQPGWFITAGYSGHYDPWGYAPLAYWPTYSHAYHRHAYYPYHDPWYYSYSGYYRNNQFRHPYGYGYGAGYRYGNHYGNRYGQYPYYRNTHSYRPPGQQQPSTGNRPDPVVIPPNERGRRGASGEFNRRVEDGSRQRETHQLGRRATAVVDVEQDLSRSTTLAPTQAGDQGMTVSSRSERKIRESRLEPVGAQSINVQPNDAGGTPNGAEATQSAGQRIYSTGPVRRSTPGIPVTSGRSSRGYQTPTETVRTAPDPRSREAARQIVAPAAVPPARSEQGFRQAPVRSEPNRPQPNRQPYQQPNQQAPAPRNAPNYQQRLDSSNVVPRADRRQSRDTQSERDREND